MGADRNADEVLGIAKEPQQAPFRSAYGFCPVCGKPGESRERRPGGNDRCEAGHVYPSAKALLPHALYRVK